MPPHLQKKRGVQDDQTHHFVIFQCFFSVFFVRAKHDSQEYKKVYEIPRITGNKQNSDVI
jgi:hypothetical protein